MVELNLIHIAISHWLFRSECHRNPYDSDLDGSLRISWDDWAEFVGWLSVALPLCM